MKYTIKVVDGKKSETMDLEGTLEYAKNLIDSKTVSKLSIIASNGDIVYTYNGEERTKKLYLELCRDCIAEVARYGGHQQLDGTVVKIDDIEIIEVDIDDCMNEAVGRADGIWF